MKRCNAGTITSRGCCLIGPPRIAATTFCSTGPVRNDRMRSLKARCFRDDDNDCGNPRAEAIRLFLAPGQSTAYVVVNQSDHRICDRVNWPSPCLAGLPMGTYRLEPERQDCHHRRSEDLVWPKRAKSRTRKRNGRGGSPETVDTFRAVFFESACRLLHVSPSYK